MHEPPELVSIACMDTHAICDMGMMRRSQGGLTCSASDKTLHPVQHFTTQNPSNQN